MYLPVSTSMAFTGATRNRSIWPLSRSRTIDSALRVMARCWMTSASTAGPKKLRTLGSVGATFCVVAVVGSAMTSGDRFSTRGPSSPSARSIPAAAACRMISALRALTMVETASRASPS